MTNLERQILDLYRQLRPEQKADFRALLKAVDAAQGSALPVIPPRPSPDA